MRVRGFVKIPTFCGSRLVPTAGEGAGGGHSTLMRTFCGWYNFTFAEISENWSSCRAVGLKQGAGGRNYNTKN